MRGQLDVREYHGRQSDLLSIQNDGMIPEDAFLAQTLDAPPAGGLRQADALADCRGIDAGFILQEIEDFAIRGIERNSLHDLYVLFEQVA
jgi:hypothetical protein